MRQINGGRGALWTAISAICLSVVGGALLAGGSYLLWLGGSPYYAVAGVLALISAWGYWRRRRMGERVYALLLLGTLVWSIFESWSNPWALGARTFAPAVLGLWLASPWVRRGLRDSAGAAFWRSEAGLAAILMLLVLVISFAKFEQDMTVAKGPSSFDDRRSPAETDWPYYGNSLRGERYAALAQVNTGNVDELQVAWVHRSGHIGNVVEATPIKVGDTLYTCGPDLMVYALDARTGRERWRAASGIGAGTYPLAMCRGVAFHHRPDASGPCVNRILYTVPGALRAIDAASGAACPDFGRGGSVSLLENMGQVDPALYNSTSAPLIVSGLVIVNSKIADNRNLDVPSGVIKAFDARTGAMRWAWDMGAPGRMGAPTQGEIFTRSTPNSWAPMSADEALGLIYVPMGNPSLDFYGVERRPMDETFGSALVALDISTGRPRWSFRTVLHDLWDYDLPAQPVLVDLPGAKGSRPAVVQVTKQGHIFVLDRRDGTPIIPIEQRLVPQGGMAGEKLSRTQPIPAISLAPPVLTESQMWGATPIDQLWCRVAFRRARYEGMYTPPGLRTTVQYPGSQGVFEWGGIAVDLGKGVAVANTTDFPWTTRLVPRSEAPEGDKEYSAQKNTPYALLTQPFLGPLKMPCKQPPWGKLAAIDLSSGKIQWRVPLGTARDTGPLGSSLGLPLTIGQVNMGGSLTTRGGLTFIAATLDRYLRAYDTRSGRELAKLRLPAGAHANPMTYASGGRQYVVITAGGHKFLGTKAGDYTIAYALPDGGKSDRRGQARLVRHDD